LEQLGPLFDRERRERTKRLHALKGTECASKEIRTIVPAAKLGRIDTVFVPVGVQRWGTFDPDSLEVEEHPAHAPGDIDLLDAAAVWTLRNSGNVYVESADTSSLDPLPAAIFRY